MVKRLDIADHVIADLRELAALTSDEYGAQRVAWSPVWAKAVSWFTQKMEAAGAVVTMDGAGNSWAKFAGDQEESIVIGSHIDSVPNGGWLDGVLGVVAAMGVGQYGLPAGKRKKTVYVVAWADEEGIAFGTSCLSSGVASGSVTASRLMKLVHRDGRSLPEVWKQYGLTASKANQVHDAFIGRHVCAYVELHIEQAPLLAQSRQSCACVYGVCGCRRQYITFAGQQGHCGSPVDQRHDAFIAAAEATLAFKKLARTYHAYCTVGHVEVEPNMITVSPGYCRISLDQRCIDGTQLKKMIAETDAICQERASANGVSVSYTPIWDKMPVLFDEALRKQCRQAVYEETGTAAEMYSAPLHDAVEMANIVPSIMMFVMSDPGISHCKEENTPLPALRQAICAFLRLVEELLAEE